MTLNWLKRWFPWVELGNLRETVQLLQAEKSILEERLHGAETEREHLWSMFREALGNERAAYQMHINMSMQKSGAGVVYPDAPHYPPNHVPAATGDPVVGRQQRRMMSEVVNDATNRFVEQQMAAGRRE
jgi:hypothetical protein